MPTLEQMIAMNPPLQQMLQDAMKAGKCFRSFSFFQRAWGLCVSKSVSDS